MLVQNAYPAVPQWGLPGRPGLPSSEPASAFASAMLAGDLPAGRGCGITGPLGQRPLTCLTLQSPEPVDGPAAFGQGTASNTVSAGVEPRPSEASRCLTLANRRGRLSRERGILAW